MQPHHDGLKVRYRSTVDSSPLAPIAGYAPGCLRLERPTSRLILFTSIDWQRRRDLHPLDLRFERPTARLLGARRHQVAPRLGLAPRSFRLTGERITLILPRNKKLVPTAGIAPAPSASQAAALSAELRGNKAKGTPAGSPDASNVTGAFPPKEIGGDGGNHTHSLNLARIGRRYDCHPPKMAPPPGLPPGSSALEVRRSCD